MAGLLFLCSDHPLEQFLKHAFSFPFSSVGLVFANHIPGKNQWKIYLIDVFDIYSNKPNKNYNLNNDRYESAVTELEVSDLLGNNLISRLWVRWLILPEWQETEMRIAAAATFTKITRPTPQQIIYELVGVNNTMNSDGFSQPSYCNALEVLVEILSRANISFDNWKPSLATKTHGTSIDAKGAATFLGMLAQPFSNEDPRWRGINQIGHLEEISLPVQNPLERDTKINASLAQSLPFFSTLSNEFLTSFTLKPEFMMATLRKFNERSILTNLLLSSLALNCELLKAKSSKELQKHEAKVTELITKTRELGLNPL